MSRNVAVTDAQIGNLCKSRLQCCQKLCFQHAVNIISGVVICNITADIGVEQKRIYDLVRIFSIAAKCDINIQSDIIINDTERNRIHRTIFIAEDFLCIDEVYTLILSRITTHGNTFADQGKGLFDVISETAIENTWLRRSIVYKFTGLCADFDDLTLIDDQHTLTVVDSNDRAVGNNIILTPCIAACTFIARALFPFCYQYICCHGVAVKILTPLISECRSDRISGCFD